MFLDTHAIVFLHAGETALFSESALHLLERERLHASPMALLELQYLFEIGRIRVGAEQIMDDLEADIGLRLREERWLEVTRIALEQSWTRDPFDRVIAAQAIVEKERLLSKDRLILEHCPLAFW